MSATDTGSDPARAPQRIVPYLSYADADAAIDFLANAFGFEERFRHPMPDGRIGHAELGFAGNVIMLASAYPEIGFVSPLDLSGRHAQVMCFVDDVDAHYARALDAGATIAEKLKDEDHGRSYRAVDPEGHRWIFSSSPPD
jgi:PhnB protein